MRQQQSRAALAAWQAFLSTPLDTVLALHREVDPQQAVVDLFQSVVASVPAYQAFLAEYNVDAAAINTFDAFQRLPLITKKNYLLMHPLPDLCRGGRLESCDMIAVSSGSTGKPTFWPRFVADELQIATRFEQIFHDGFRADERRTLAVICFTLGTWVGGMFTAACCRHLASKDYPITVITPGNNKAEIFRVVRDLGPLFDQVVLLGYPPFLKDVIDTGVVEGIAWQPLHVKLVMAGEVFSEEWRSLVGERAGSQNPCYDSASLYGTADAGVLGNETPLSICIRRFLADHPDTASRLFGEARLPTLVQYDPLSRYFETQERTLLVTGDNGVPLIRYNILDTGGVISYDSMLAFLADYDFDPVAELGRDARGIHPIPFVYVFGRSDFTVSFFGANIYPENISVGLEQPAVNAWVTGKFVLEVGEDADRNRFLSITVELAPGVEGTSERRDEIAASILSSLLRLNSEFANYVPPEWRAPRVTLRPTGDPDYFPLGVKHRYTRKPG